MSEQSSEVTNTDVPGVTETEAALGPPLVEPFDEDL